MTPLRIVLVAGLLLHKFVWEALKRDRPTPTGCAPLSPAKRLVKYGKAGALAFIVVQAFALNVLPITKRSRALRAAGVALYLLGLTTAILGRLHLGGNWMDIEDRQVKPNQGLTTGGIYQYIRHPIYTGDILLVTGLELALNSWLVLGAALPAIVAAKQAVAEEEILARAFDGYAAYQKTSKRFIPFVY